MDNYESKALQYAEKYGIVDYMVKNNQMTYIEVFPTEGAIKCIVNLDTMKETRSFYKNPPHK